MSPLTATMGEPITRVGRSIGDSLCWLCRIRTGKLRASQPFPSGNRNLFSFPRVAREKAMEGGKSNPAEHRRHECRVELSRKQETIAGGVPFREQASGLNSNVGANTGSLLVIDEAEGRISNQETVARTHGPVQFFEVKEVRFLHKPHSLEKLPSHEHRCTMHIIDRL